MTYLEALNAQITIKIRELDALRAKREALSPSPPVDLHPCAELSAECLALRAENQLLTYELHYRPALDAEKETLKAELKAERAEMDRRFEQCSRHLGITDRRIEQLQTALRHISLAAQSSMGTKEECGRIARAALTGKRET